MSDKVSSKVGELAGASVTSGNTKNESKLTTVLREAGAEAFVNRGEERAIICRHSSQVSWDHLLDVIRTAQAEILSDFTASLLMTDSKRTTSFEPFNLTLSFWRKGRMLTKRHTKLTIAHTDHFDEKAEELLAKLPKMLWELKKTHTSGKSDLLMIAFEWLETVDSKPAKDLVETVKKMMIEKQDN